MNKVDEYFEKNYEKLVQIRRAKFNSGGQDVLHSEYLLARGYDPATGEPLKNRKPLDFITKKGSINLMKETVRRYMNKNKIRNVHEVINAFNPHMDEAIQKEERERWCEEKINKLKKSGLIDEKFETMTEKQRVRVLIEIIKKIKRKKRLEEETGQMKLFDNEEEIR
jgi:hypothetical protein